MAARVRTDVLTYKMPDVYGMSKDAYNASLKGSMGRNIGRIANAIAARNAAENIAAHQASEQARKNKETGTYASPNYDSALGEITAEDKQYDPFAVDTTSDVGPLFIEEDTAYNRNDLFPNLSALEKLSTEDNEQEPFTMFME